MRETARQPRRAYATMARTKDMSAGCAAGVLALWVIACGSTPPAHQPVQPGEGGVKRDTRIVHEPCDVDGSRAQRFDVNGDGQPDLVVVKDGARELCRSVDMNFDGRVDVWVYYDENGQVRRRESDLDRDGQIDDISVYENGQIVARQNATKLGGRIDTWHFYANGTLTQSERDADGDGVIDQWWEYPQAKLECPLVHTDVDGDGRPDPDATVNLCPPPEDFGAPAAGGVAQAPPQPTAASRGEQHAAAEAEAPTETTPAAGSVSEDSPTETQEEGP